MLYPHWSGILIVSGTTFSYEGPGYWRGWQGARAGVEAAPVAARVANILPARKWRHLRRSYLPAGRSQEPFEFAGGCAPDSAGFDRGWAGNRPVTGRGGRVHAPRAEDLWSHAAGRATGNQQELCQGVHATAPGSHGALRRLHNRRRSAQVIGTFLDAGGGES